VHDIPSRVLSPGEKPPAESSEAPAPDAAQPAPSQHFTEAN
jgi:hypothetical protein